MTREHIFEQIRLKKSFLCVGLDTDSTKLPKHLLKHEDPVYEFNRQIIEATQEYCVAFKPNLAFYECDGIKGWQSLERSLRAIPFNCFTIADAKRGDIGNTSTMYAKAFFENLGFDSVTVAPYMGRDSVKPFLAYADKWVILLALTSNEGSADFQLQASGDELLFEKVLRTSQTWGSTDSMMYVVGATQAAMMKKVRAIAPDHFLLVPGVGAQGGSLSETAANGMNKQCGLLVNASRSILYASSGEDFADKAHAEAKKLRDEMSVLLDKYLG
ncbi:MAG: orotidine 5''-phosphate decarboxylase [Bacteroidetes bacterium]|nr:MAG: orotidine 5''-phosphate decarboxylase [Bacteroidota bacterium]